MMHGAYNVKLTMQYFSASARPREKSVVVVMSEEAFEPSDVKKAQVCWLLLHNIQLRIFYRHVRSNRGVALTTHLAPRLRKE